MRVAQVGAGQGGSGGPLAFGVPQALSTAEWGPVEIAMVRGTRRYAFLGGPEWIDVVYDSEGELCRLGEGGGLFVFTTGGISASGEARHWREDVPQEVRDRFAGAK